ncbi:methylmalonyl-CoA mutase family protein [Kaistella palustris]|uniref:methylmalonyl-CoA mutase family protein n=1 Tax=Kaistella palustris TaxID=493376 RepID=UPI000427D84F|nr:methylmalonyl-CoA mutase family protein [Kaistella palustris]
MFEKITLRDWEKMVQKQLKTEDIYAVLSKENLEGIDVKPYYSNVPLSLINLPKAVESTHLVSPYHENSEDNAFAFLLDQNVEGLAEKVIFVNNRDLAEHISLADENTYFSLIDIFSEDSTGEINVQLGKELLAKNFNRNIAVDISLHQNAGASIIQQVAFALLKTKELTENFGGEILNKIIFRIAVGGNYFFEIAKLRALKLVVNQFSKEFGLAETPFIFAETTLRNKAKNDGENNLIRSTLELSAAMIGGADAVFSNAYKLDEGNSLSEEISFKQQVVLAYESIINVFEDAGNGSYYIEDITRQIADKSWQLFLTLENEGGYCALLKAGKIQKLIYTQAVNEQNWVAEGKIKLIGVNLYPKLEKTKSAEELYDPSKISAVRLAEMFE